jgi:hypothetical protein
MGFPDLQRELVRARNTYLGAVRRWREAGAAFEAAAVPLLPSEDGTFAPWTDDHAAVMSVCAEAWARLIAAQWGYNAAVEDLLANDTASPMR